MRSGLQFSRTAPRDVTDAARRILAALVKDNVESLVGRFYEAFLADEEASAYLSHSVVHERLNHSLRNWLVDLIQVDPHADLAAFSARQIKIGEVHARLKIPVHLVLEGASLLKTEIGVRIMAGGHDPATLGTALLMLDETVDYAMRLMSGAYFNDTKRRIQTDEAFRLFSLGQDISLEREIQRASLMEWSQSVLFQLFAQDAVAAPGKLSSSEFGLWLRHRAMVLFQGSPFIATIEELVGRIDAEILPMIGGGNHAAVNELQQKIEEIKYLLNDLFQSAASIENGRDPLTRTLNRRFLPSVLGRELTLAKDTNVPLSVLMVDVDHFKRINDAHGHSAGDAVLRHTAELLLNTVRSSDFVFRYGGEEFLVVLVETDRQEAASVAERIRRDIAGHRIQLPDRGPVSLTVSIGVATHEGHPDYEYLINAADKALYAAKAGGRNRVAEAAAAA